MADTTTITCTEKRGSTYGDAYETGSVYTRTFTFATLNDATGYGASDVLNLITLPANTAIIGAYAKSSVTQGSATFAFNLTGDTAFISAVAVTQTANFQALAIADATKAFTPATDAGTVLQCVIGSATCAAATVTVTLVLAALGTALPAATTYSN